jgi:translation initiation factor 2 subunit 1
MSHSNETSPAVSSASASLVSVQSPAVVHGSNAAKFQCRMYENVYPEVNDLVMVTVQQIADMGAYVTLNEYNNLEGMVLLSELSRRRIRSVQRLIRVGKSEVVVVLRVDKEKGYIDLSKRRVTPEEVEKFEEKYNKTKAVHSILRHVAEKRDMPLETLYAQVGWPLYRRYGHAFEAFKAALTDPGTVFPEGLVEAGVRADILANIVRRLTPQKLKIRADIEAACFGYEGVDAVRAALAAGEAQSTEDVPIKVKLVAPPLYVLLTTCMDKARGLETMQRALDAIEASLKPTPGGQLVVKMRPKAVSESEDKELADLMKKAEFENAEVSGDDETDEL